MARSFKSVVSIDDQASASSEALRLKVTGESNARLSVDAGGKLTWGSGSASGDATLYRSAANALKTDDTFQAALGVITLTTDGAPSSSLADGAVAVDTTNDSLYFRSSSNWQAISNLIISDGAPSGPVAGDLWFESDTGRTFVYYADGSSNQWIEIGSASSSGVHGAAGKVQFSEGNTFASDTLLHWDNSNNRLGVGTASPAHTFHVEGTPLARDSGWASSGDLAIWALGSSVGAAERFGVGYKHSTGMIMSVYKSGGSGSFGSNSYDAMTILDTSGNVGIGTTAPTAPLHLFGAGDGVDQIKISSTGGTVAEYGFLGANASTNAMRYGYWTGSGYGNHLFEGNVGIGTASPAGRLHIVDSTPTFQLTNTNAFGTSGGTDTLADIDFEGQKNGLYRTTARIRARQNGTWSNSTADDADSALEFYANNGSGMQGVATMTGYNVALGINDDRTPDSGGNGQVQFRFSGYTGFVAGNGTGMYIGTNSSSRNTYLMTNETVALELGGGSQEIKALSAYNSTTSAAANMHVSSLGQFLRSTSSAKYKTGVEDVTDAYADAVLNLRPVWYRSLARNDRSDWSHWGLIAEEVAAIDPRLVTYGYEYESDADTGAIVWDSEPVLDADGNPTYNDDDVAITRKTAPRTALDGDGNPVSAPEEVQYARIVPLLINLIKRQDARIAALESA